DKVVVADDCDFVAIERNLLGAPEAFREGFQSRHLWQELRAERFKRNAQKGLIGIEYVIVQGLGIDSERFHSLYTVCKVGDCGVVPVVDIVDKFGPTEVFYYGLPFIPIETDSHTAHEHALDMVPFERRRKFA